MPLVLRDQRTRNVPHRSTLLVKVVSHSNQVNTTGRVDDPKNAGVDLTHGAIFNRVKKVPLKGVGIHIARVNLILNATTQQTATVEYAIEDPSGNQIRTFQPVFTGKSTGSDKFIGRAKWTISVV